MNRPFKSVQLSTLAESIGTIKPTTSAEFYEILVGHDWTYYMSDDHRVYERGHNESRRVYQIAQESDGNMDLYSRFKESIFSGKIWGTDKRPLPERPNESR